MAVARACLPGVLEACSGCHRAHLVFFIWLHGAFGRPISRAQSPESQPGEMKVGEQAEWEK